MLEAVRTVTHKIGKYAEITLNTCAYAGTGNVLKVQEMLRICAEHLTVILTYLTLPNYPTLSQTRPPPHHIETYPYLLLYIMFFGLYDPK